MTGRLLAYALAGLGAGVTLSPVTAAGQAQTRAETPAQAPTVLVAGFSADSASKLSAKVTDAMVDVLAQQLVDSARYRVLDRTWLGVEAGKPFRELTAQVRDRARDAGVTLVVVGRVRKVREVVGYGPSRRTVPTNGPRIGYGGPTVRQAVRYADRLHVVVELRDAITGAVLTQSSGSCAMPRKSLVPRTPLVAASSSPIVAVAALAIRARASSGTLDTGLERTVATAAQALVRWRASSGARTPGL